MKLVSLLKIANRKQKFVLNATLLIVQVITQKLPGNFYNWKGNWSAACEGCRFKKMILQILWANLKKFLACSLASKEETHAFMLSKKTQLLATTAYQNNYQRYFGSKLEQF